MKKTEITTQDGTAECYIFQPEGDGAYPAIIFYMDGVGIRQALFDMAQRLADNGYYVLLPNLYYRAGAYAPFHPATVFNSTSERERLILLIRSLSNEMLMQDTAVFLSFLNQQLSVRGSAVGCVGYCLGGRCALLAAGTFPDRITAAASLHGGSLVTDRPDSPHLLAHAMRGTIYVGAPEVDHGFTEAHRQDLQAAFDEAHVKYIIEVYPNASHGFAIPDLPVYNQEAAELHWERILRLFRETLS